MRLIIVFSIAIIITSIYFIMIGMTPNKPISGKGSTIENQSNATSIGGKFSLTNHRGEIFSEQDLKGKMTLIYFGFTFCPDICPTSLEKFSKVVDVLAKYNINVTPIFITVDPKRDTQAVLREYLTYFNPKIIGLTGTESQIKDVADKFKIFYSISLNNSNNDHYMIDHTSLCYLFDKDGKYYTHFYYDTSPEEIIEYIRIRKNDL